MTNEINGTDVRNEIFMIVAASLISAFPRCLNFPVSEFKSMAKPTLGSNADDLPDSE